MESARVCNTCQPKSVRTGALTAPAEGLGHMTRVAGIFDESGIVLDDIGLKRPSLDDVFLHLTGHRAEDGAEDDETAGQPAGEMTR